MSSGNNQSKIISALESLVEKRRIVFWYDESGEMEETVKRLSLPGIEVVKLDRNPLSVKYRILKEKMPERGYIVYSCEPRPEDEENWLLDLESEGAVFSADTVSLYASECGIAQELRNKVVEPHLNFFKDGKNRDKLTVRLRPGMDAPEIIRQMISVTVDGEPGYDRVLLLLAKEAQEEKTTITDRLREYDLLPIIWKEIEWNFNYTGRQEIKDLLVTLFMDDLTRHHSGGKLSNAAHIFMRDWRNNFTYRALYEKWARQLEKELGIAKQIGNWPLTELLDVETFPIIDKIIAVQLQGEVINETMNVQQVEEIVRKREHKVFAKEASSNSLQALLEARRLTDSIKRIMPGLQINTPEEGFRIYIAELHEIDRYYRNFIRSAKASEGKRMIVPLLEKIQPLYTNSFLDELARKWQPIVDGMEKWRFEQIPSQREFYMRYVAPMLDKNKKVFVIISDALRYETAVELTERIGGVERAVASMLPTMVSTLPSYTQLGMAALLPHSRLGYDKASDEVFADGLSTKGTPARENVLKKKVPNSLAITAKDFLDITNPKAEFKKYDLIYIYSDTIDFTGDKLKTEDKVFASTEDEIKNILEIIRHIKNGNGTNILITADHGYIYQNETLDESEFSDYKASGNIISDTRRHIIGENLTPDPSVKTWRSDDVGLKPGKDIQIAKGINRMRKQGSGSKFVHGGAMLQEIVVPVIHVSIKKTATISQVDVDVLNSRGRLTTNRQTVSFYQTEAVGDQVLPSVIKVGFYDEEGNLLSDSPTLTFDCKTNDSRQREQKHTFIFKNELSALNGKEVILRLERKVRDSEQFVPYKEEPYKVSVMFANEF